MKLLFLRNRKIAAALMMFSLFGLLYSCQELEDLIHHPQKPSSQEKADVVYDWYELIVEIQLNSSPYPQLHTNLKNLGYIGVGLYEAVYPGTKGAVSLSSKLYQMPAMPEPEKHREYLWGASANAALASMCKQFLGLSDADMARIESMENAYNEKFRAKTSEAVFTRSQAFGRAIATSIYDWSTTDNFTVSNEGYIIPEFPGAWVPTPPAFANPIGPFIADSRPFLEYSLTATAPPLPFPYSEDPSSEFYKAAKEVYDIGATLTDEQKAIADLWGGVGGPGVAFAGGGHLLSITTDVLKSKKAKLGQAAEVYAKTGIGLKDGPIVTWRGKFGFNLIRPITYINQHIDPAYLSYLTNPPYPEYPSGLAGLYSPVFQVLIREFGDIPVTDNAYDWRGVVPRHYASITEMNIESASSRVYGGLHYQFTMDISREIGKQLGDQIANIDLTPKY